MVRARNDGEQGKRCGIAGQSGPKSFAAAFVIILSENVLLCRILAVVWQRCWYMEAGNVLNVGKPKSMRDQRFCLVKDGHLPWNEGSKRRTLSMNLHGVCRCAGAMYR